MGSKLLRIGSRVGGIIFLLSSGIGGAWRAVTKLTEFYTSAKEASELGEEVKHWTTELHWFVVTALVGIVLIVASCLPTRFWKWLTGKGDQEEPATENLGVQDRMTRSPEQGHRGGDVSIVGGSYSGGAGGVHGSGGDLHITGGAAVQSHETVAQVAADALREISLLRPAIDFAFEFSGIFDERRVRVAEWATSVHRRLSWVAPELAREFGEGQSIALMRSVPIEESKPKLLAEIDRRARVLTRFVPDGAHYEKMLARSEQKRREEQARPKDPKSDANEDRERQLRQGLLALLNEGKKLYRPGSQGPVIASRTDIIAWRNVTLKYIEASLGITWAQKFSLASEPRFHTLLGQVVSLDTEVKPIRLGEREIDGESMAIGSIVNGMCGSLEEILGSIRAVDILPSWKPWTTPTVLASAAS